MRYPFDTTVDDLTTGPNVNYMGVRRALRLCEAFRHNGTMSGGWNETGDTYYVFSYRTCIAWCNVWGESWYNPKRYSVTTSRQMTIVKAQLGNPAELFSAFSK